MLHFQNHQSEEYERKNLCQSSGEQSSDPEVFKSQEEMDQRCKDRIKKDNHNISKKHQCMIWNIRGCYKESTGNFTCL